MKYSVSGTVALGRLERTFEKTIEAKTENEAKHNIYSHFGSSNAVGRTRVKIVKIEKAKE